MSTCTDGRLYVGQTELLFTMTVTDQCADVVDLTDATVILKGIKPDGTSLTWTVTISDPTNGVVTWQPASTSDLNLQGIYTIWPHITFSTSGNAIAGEPYRFQVYTEGAKN